MAAIFLPNQVISGFTSGAAIIIALSQLKHPGLGRAQGPHHLALFGVQHGPPQKRIGKKNWQKTTILSKLFGYVWLWECQLASRYVLGYDLPKSQYIYETSLVCSFKVDRGMVLVKKNEGDVGIRISKSC